MHLIFLLSNVLNPWSQPVLNHSNGTGVFAHYLVSSLTAISEIIHSFKQETNQTFQSLHLFNIVEETKENKVTFQAIL